MRIWREGSKMAGRYQLPPSVHHPPPVRQPWTMVASSLPPTTLRCSNIIISSVVDNEESRWTMTAVDGRRSRVAGERNLAFVMIWIIGGSRQQQLQRRPRRPSSAKQQIGLGCWRRIEKNGSTAIDHFHAIIHKFQLPLGCFGLLRGRWACLASIDNHPPPSSLVSLRIHTMMQQQIMNDHIPK